jgi:hypothetical protein
MVKEQNLIDTLAIRTMSKAKYSTDNIGHYGLAFDYYSFYFTNSSLSWCYGTPFAALFREQNLLTKNIWKQMFTFFYGRFSNKCREILLNTCRLNTCKIIRSRVLSNFRWQNGEFMLIIEINVKEWYVFVI